MPWPDGSFPAKPNAQCRCLRSWTLLFRTCWCLIHAPRDEWLGVTRDASSQCGHPACLTRSVSGVRRIGQRLHLSDRSFQTPPLEDVGGKLRNDGVRPDLGADALDIHEELRGFLNELKRVRRKSVRKHDPYS